MLLLFTSALYGAAYAALYKFSPSLPFLQEVFKEKKQDGDGIIIMQTNKVVSMCAYKEEEQEIHEGVQQESTQEKEQQNRNNRIIQEQVVCDISLVSYRNLQNQQYPKFLLNFSFLLLLYFAAASSFPSSSSCFSFFP